MVTHCFNIEINQYNFQYRAEALIFNEKKEIFKKSLRKTNTKKDIPRNMPGNSLFLLIVILLFLPNRVLASGFNPTNLYADVSESIVVVIASDSNTGKKSFGTGSIIHKDGLILTNAHIIINKDNKRPFKKLYIILKPDLITGNFKKDTSRIYRSSLIKYSEKMDLALIKIEPVSEAKFRAINFADSNLVSIGDPVLAIGHPENGGLWSLTTGTISSKINNFQKILGKNVFQTETSFNRGNSGGPLVDKNGRLVGINSNFSRINKEGLPVIGINFSIMSNVASQWIKSLSLDITFDREKKPNKPSIIQEANIVPVSDFSYKKTNVISKAKNLEPLISIKKIEPSKKENHNIFENDLEKMMILMRKKIKKYKVKSN
jgi:serine protease Do